jgi:hypothetical protein
MNPKPGPYHRLGKPGGPTCPVGVLPVQFHAQGDAVKDGVLLDAGQCATEVELLRTIASRLGVRWGHDPLGWWAAVPATDFPSWSVWRQDDNGNAFLMQANLTMCEATALVERYERQGHKQCYWARDERAEA